MYLGLTSLVSSTLLELVNFVPMKQVAQKLFYEGGLLLPETTKVHQLHSCSHWRHLLVMICHLCLADSFALLPCSVILIIERVRDETRVFQLSNLMDTKKATHISCSRSFSLSPVSFCFSSLSPFFIFCAFLNFIRKNVYLGVKFKVWRTSKSRKGLESLMPLIAIKKLSTPLLKTH